MSTLIDIVLPKLGESVAEATIIKWHKAVGDKVSKDEVFVEIGTDKVDTELPSEYAGVITNIAIEQGEKVLVGKVICTIESDDDMIVIPQVIDEEVITVSKEVSKPNNLDNQLVKKYNNDIFMSPVVRNMVAQKEISPDQLAEITGSGAKGRITKKDVQLFLNNSISTVHSHGVIVPAKRSLAIEDGDEVQKLSRIRQVIARNMLESVQTIPHVTTFVEVDVTEMVNWRKANKQKFQETLNEKLTYTHIIMKAIIDVLGQFPKLNAWMNGNDELIIKRNVNLGFATALENGNLVVPNIKAAQDLTLEGLVTNVNEIGRGGKAGTLLPSAYENTTITVSNTGIFGSLMGTPIISVPQVAVIALGEIQRKAAMFLQENKEHIAIRDVMTVSMSYDHRVIDGAYGASFLRALKNKLMEKQT